MTGPGDLSRSSPHSEDDFGRMLAAVTLADGRDLAQLMIGSGNARPRSGPTPGA